MHRFHRSLVWFRRDLRCFDHAALHHALKQGKHVFCAFILDKAILDSLPREDRRVEFIHASLTELARELRALGGYLIVRYADAAEEIPKLAGELDVDAVFSNRDYEPQAMLRDAQVEGALHAAGRAWLSYKDQVIFEKDEVLSQSGRPFSVFTPYKKTWLKALHEHEECLQAYEVESLRASFASPGDASCEILPTLDEIGFRKTNLTELKIPTGMSGGEGLYNDFLGRMKDYDRARDFPAIKGPSYLSVHLRFGTISIRGLVREALNAMRVADGGNGAGTWLSELIWRDFYFMILHHHPHVAERAFKPEYDAIRWEHGANTDELFQSWCEARTGYPLVDAAMLQLNRTGYMHNRLRMVTASFLIKDLGIDWRRGERYFAERLIDFDLAANNGGWQWAASSGCDAQPYFRIFNPVTQSEKFDPEGKFIRRYLPQLVRLPDKFIHAPWLAPAAILQAAGVTLGSDYPPPIIQHDTARKLTLQRYSVVKKSSGQE